MVERELRGWFAWRAVCYLPSWSVLRATLSSEAFIRSVFRGCVAADAYTDYPDEYWYLLWRLYKVPSTPQTTGWYCLMRGAASRES